MRLIDGAAYVETAAGMKIRLPGVADTPPPRRDMWRRAPYWSRDPESPSRPPPWFRQP